MYPQLIATIFGVSFPLLAYADGYHIISTGWSCTGFLYCGTSGNIVTVITTTIVNGVVAFIGSLAIVVFFYGAIRMVISQGQEGKEAGKKALIWASLGLVAALLAGAIIQFVTGYISYLGS